MNILEHLRLKKRNHNLSFRRRHGLNQNLTSNDQIKLLKYKKILFASIIMFKNHPGRVIFERIMKVSIIKYLSLRYVEDIPLQPTVNYSRSIESFGQSIKKDLRFEANDIRILIRELGFLNIVKFDNRIKMSGEEVFLRGLFELVTGSCKHDIANQFGRDFSAQSRAFNYFIDNIYDNYHHLVHDNLSWWKRNGFWAMSAEAIELRMAERYPTENKNMVSHFIDCNCLPTTVTGGGPAEEGANAARYNKSFNVTHSFTILSYNFIILPFSIYILYFDRWDENIQRTFYNGWKSIHGIKHQSVDNAWGITEDLHGPASVRRNDLALLRLSNINNRFAQEQVNELHQYIMMGDSAYNKDTHLTSYHKHNHMIDNYIKWNKSMKHVRISIEWNYGVTGTLFKYTRNKNKFKILDNSRVSKIYTVATLFRNFHIMCYGGQTSQYFKLEVPQNMLVHYINQINFN